MTQFTSTGTIAEELYSSGSRVDELLRQFGREWATATNLTFREYRQQINGQSIFAVGVPKELWRKRPFGVLSFGASQPVEPLDPQRIINVRADCYSDEPARALELCFTLYHLLRGSKGTGSGRPFVRVPRVASLGGIPGIPVKLIDRWPLNATNQPVWNGWRMTVVNLGLPPQLIGRTGHNPDGSCQAMMVFQCMASPVQVTAPDVSIEISSTNDRASVEVLALPRVAPDGQFSSEEERLHLRWRDGQGTDQSVVIDFDTDPTVAELKALVEAESGWTFNITDAGVSGSPARHLYSTPETDVTDTQVAGLRVVQEN